LDGKEEEPNVWGYIRGVDGNILYGYPLIYCMLKVSFNAYIRIITEMESFTHGRVDGISLPDWG